MVCSGAKYSLRPMNRWVAVVLIVIPVTFVEFLGVTTSSSIPIQLKTVPQGCTVGGGPCSDKDQVAYDAISALHRQIDDDHDGDVDLTESDEFLRDELHYTNDYERHNKFHGKDSKVSVPELWKIWKTSEVHNWTVEETLSWLDTYVELPQYQETFRAKEVNGAFLPRIATNPQFISTILGIKNAVHKQKLALKAMDVVLFGAPKRGHSYLKDLVLVTSLIIATGGCWFAYLQHKNSKSHLHKMMKDLESLQKAEDSLSQLQEKLDIAQKEQQNVQEEKLSMEQKMKDEIDVTKREAQRLKEQRENADEAEKRYKLAEEELEHVRTLLGQAEQQLEGHQWIPSTELQQWLQLTYEIELKHYNTKRTAAEKQLTIAKEGCDKIRKKRGAFMGSLRIAHSSSIDSIDARIMDARSALEEVRQDLQERLNRWRKIELLCGFPIINNPGISVLESALRSTAQSPGQTSLSSQGLPLYNSQSDLIRRGSGALSNRGRSEVWNMGHRNESGSAINGQDDTAAEVCTPDCDKVTFTLEGGPSSPGSTDSAEPPFASAATAAPPKLRQSVSLQERQPPNGQARPTSLPVSHSDPLMAFMGAQVNIRQATSPTAEDRNRDQCLGTGVNGHGKSPSANNATDRTKDTIDPVNRSDDENKSDDNVETTIIPEDKKRKHRLGIHVFSKKEKPKKA